MPIRTRVLALALLAAPSLLVAQRTPVAPANRPDTSKLKALKYRYLGPEGNRVTSIAGVNGDPFTYYAGAASGGLWKTIDGGIHWAAISDSVPVSSIGSVTVAPSDPNIVWIGTGEPFIRSHISIGWG